MSKVPIDWYKAVTRTEDLWAVKLAKNGKASIVDDGKEYDGEWKDGKKHGKGTEVFQNKAKYIGEFQKGKAHGKGSIIFPDGSKYDGEWMNDLYEGQGVWTTANEGSYEGKFKDGYPHGKGSRTTPLGSKFDGEFRHGRPFEGIWTSPAPSLVKTPFKAKGEGLALSKESNLSFIIALDMYLHLVIGLLLAYWIGYLRIWIFHLDTIILLPVIEGVIFLERLYPNMKFMLHSKDPTKSNSVSKKPFNIDPDKLSELKKQAQNDIINMDFEWFNYTLAQLWHTYEGWAGEYIRLQLESSIGSTKYLTVDKCTLGKVPITVTKLYSKPRNLDPQLRRERELDSETSSEDQIVDLYANLDWCSDFMIRLKLFGLLPISIENISLQAPIRMVFEWLALDSRDPLSYPNLPYLALESVGRFDLTLSFKLFGFLDLFSIPPFATLLQQDYLLDVLYDCLDPGVGMWLDFIRGKAESRCVIMDSRSAQAEGAKMTRREAGDVEGLLRAAPESRLQISVVVLSAEGQQFRNPVCKLRVGSKAKIDAAKALDIEKQTKTAGSGSQIQWNAEDFSWFASATINSADADWISVTLIDSSMFGSQKTLGSWKSKISDIIFSNEIITNGPAKKIRCPLVETSPSETKNQSKELKTGPTVLIEFGIYSLGLSHSKGAAKDGELTNSLGEEKDGKPLTEFADEMGKPAVVHIKLQDCHNLHCKLNSKLPAANKIKPHVRFYFGTFEYLEKFDRTKGFGEKWKTDKILQQNVREWKSVAIEPGLPIMWSDESGKIIFQEDIPAGKLCLLAEVYHENVIMGSTFVKMEELALDCKLNGFRLQDAQMIRPLCCAEDEVIRGTGEKTSPKFWVGKPFETLMHLEIPLITLFIFLNPKTHFRPVIKVKILRTSALPKTSFSRPDPYVIVALSNDKDKRGSAPGSKADALQRHETGVLHGTYEPIWIENNTFTLNRDPEENSWKEQTLELILMDYNRMTSSTEIGSWKSYLKDLYKPEKKGSEAGCKPFELPLTGVDNVKLFCAFEFLGDWL